MQGPSNATTSSRYVASGISEVAGSKLVLKGGTSLRLAHFGDYRFSADLDYSATGLDHSRARGHGQNLRMYLEI
jgi:predicted nucleotidyltransferase component of viral defense system